MGRAAERLGELPMTHLDWSRALAHPVRVAILQHLLDRQSEASPKELAETLGLRLGNASYHTRCLADTGLVTLTSRVTRRGAVAHRYRLTDPRATTDALRHLGGEITAEFAPPLSVPPEWATLQRVMSELRARRKAQGISHETLASRLQVKPSYLASVELCEADPRYTLLAQLALELGTNIGEVFSRAQTVAER